MGNRYDEEFSVDDILKDAEVIKEKIIEREKEEQGKNISQKVENIKNDMADKKHYPEENSFSSKLKLNKKNKMENIFSDTSNKIKIKVTNPLDVVDETIDLKSENAVKTVNNIKEEKKDKTSKPLNVKDKTKNKTLSNNADIKKKDNEKDSNSSYKGKDKIKKPNIPTIEIRDDFNTRPDTIRAEFEELKKYNDSIKETKYKTEKSDFQKTKIENNKVKKYKLFLLNKKEECDPYSEFSDDFQMQDYTSPNDIDRIKKDLNSDCKLESTRSVFLSIFMLISIGFTLLLKFLNYFPQLNDSKVEIIYPYTILALLLICFFMCFSTVKNGIIGILKFRGNIDSPVSLALITSIIQSSIVFLDVSRFGEAKNKISLFAGITILGLLFNSLGRLYKSMRIRRNFKFVSSASSKYSLKLLEDNEKSSQVIDKLKIKKPVIAYQKRVNFLDDFLSISNDPDPSDKFLFYMSPVLAILSVILSLIILIIKKNIFEAISALSLISCMSIPMCSSFAINSSLFYVCKKSLKRNSMISGYKAIKDFSAVNTVVVDQNDIFPSGSVNLIGFKTFSALRLDDSILAATSVVNSANSPVSSVFDSVLKEKSSSIPKSSETKYINGLGLVSWVNGKRILIGNRELLKEYKIAPPSKKFETQYQKKHHEITYLAKGGELVAAFILSYSPIKEIKLKMQNLEENGVAIVVKTTDQNITPEFIADKFGIFVKNVEVISKDEFYLVSDMDGHVDASAPAILASKGNIASFFALISSCIRLHASILVITTLQIISVILGVVIVSMISFYSCGVESIGFFEILIYVSLWNLATIFISKVKRPR